MDSERERENFNHALSSDPSSYFNPLLTHENSQLYRADFEIDVSYRWVYRSRRSHDAPSLNRHRPGRKPRNFLFVLIRRGGSQVRLRAGSQGDARESRRRVEGRQGEGPRDVQQGRGRLQGPRPLRLLRERIGRRHDRASLPEGRAPPGHRGEEGLSPRKSDYGDGRGREDPKRDLLVASPRNRDAAREAHLLHEGGGPDLRGRVLQAVDVRHVHALSLFAASSYGALKLLSFWDPRFRGVRELHTAGPQVRQAR